MIISTTLIQGWHIRQLDVKKAFLHGNITEDIYMKQPPGMADSQYPKYVYTLQKTLYGLKQAPCS